MVIQISIFKIRFLFLDFLIKSIDVGDEEFSLNARIFIDFGRLLFCNSKLSYFVFVEICLDEVKQVLQPHVKDLFVQATTGSGSFALDFESS